MYKTLVFSAVVFALCFHLAVLLALLHRQGIRPLAALMAWFRRQPALGRFLLPVLAATAVVFGGSKSPTNDVPRRVAPAAGAQARATGFTPEQLAAGFVLARVGTNEVFDFAAPAGAGIVQPWRLRGAADDQCALPLPDLPNHVFADGRLQDAVRRPRLVFRPFNAPLGIVPEANWRLLAAGGAPSQVWYGATPSNSLLVTWQNALLLRGTNAPVCAQAEFFRNGDFVYRYDLSRAAAALADGGGTNVVVGAWRDGRGEAFPVASLEDPAALTSLRWCALDPADATDPDRDGDGLSTYDEIFRHRTDPGLADTDGDGLPDGDEIAAGIDPLVRSVPDPEILGRVAASATNTELRTASVVITNSLISWKLWDGFAATRAGSAGEPLFQRTVRIDRQSNWQQFFLSSRRDRGAEWSLEGVRLEWEDSCGRSGSAVASPRGDSLYLPVSTNGPEYVTIRLVATADFVRSPTPVYLLGFAPAIRVEGGRTVPFENGSSASVFTNGVDAAVRISVDRANRPCRAALYPDELLADGLTDIWERSGGALTFSGSATGGLVRVLSPVSHALPESSIRPPSPQRLLKAATPNTIRHFLIVLSPYVYYGGGHCDFMPRCLDFDRTNHAYVVEYRWPANSACLWRKCIVGCGMSACTCEPQAGSGVVPLPGNPERLSWRITVQDGVATLRIWVDGELVWTGDALHDRFWGSCGWLETTELLTKLEDCQTCKDTCTGGVCRDYEGHELSSLHFRIPLGVPCRDGICGFAHFSARAPLAVTPDVFRYMFEPGSAVSVVTNGASRTVTCTANRGRTLFIEPMADGARVTVRMTETAELEHVWEITNVDGDAARIRLRKISRLDNVMEDFTYVCAGGRWSRRNNISGLREEVETADGLNEPGDGALRETRTTYDADDNVVSCVTCESRRIGEGPAAVLRQTHYEASDGYSQTTRDATYWRDLHFKARNGKPRLITATDAPWEYHEWDRYGRETMRVEQRDGADVPTAFPRAEGEALTELPRELVAFVTLFDYTPLAGDADDPDEHCRLRRETRFAVSDGRATVIARTWHRYTHPVAGGYAATMRETWRAASAEAAFDDPGNAYSYETRYGEMDETVPFILRGQVAAARSEDGVVTESDYSFAGGRAVCTERRSYEGRPFPLYRVRETDDVYGNLLREASYLAADDTLVDEEISRFDDRNRLRSTRYADGTSITNAYSCCRLLWSSDREGRKTLRSAVTGRDGLYYAEEEVWRRDVSTNGYRVTQHFLDGLGRETNAVTYVGTVPGEATDWRASAGRRVRTATWEYPYGLTDYTIATDARGLVTLREVREEPGAREILTSVFGDPDVAEPTRCSRTVEFRGGGSVREESWGEAWRRETETSDYDGNGCRVVSTSVESSDLGAFTNLVMRFDFLGRPVLVETPEGRTETTYHGASSRVAGETVRAGTVERTTTMLYNALGECVGSARDGVERRSETVWERRSGDWWRVTRAEDVCGAVTNALGETLVQLTGRPPDLRDRRISVSQAGVVTETTERRADGADAWIELSSNAVSGVTSILSVHGVVLESETPEELLEYDYDALGRRVSIRRRAAGSDETLAVEDARYDAFDGLVERRTYTNATAGVVERFSSDLFGREVEFADAHGEVTETAYDAGGRVVARRGAVHETRCAYDTKGRRTLLQTTRDGQTWDGTEWAYAAATDRLLSKRYADGSADSLSYTDDGLPHQKTQASGAWIRWTYDDRRLKTGETSSDGAAEATFAYDGFGRLTAVTGSVESIAYSRDRRGEVTNETFASAGRTVAAFGRTYDANGRISGRGLADGSWQTVGYDGRNCLASLVQPEAAVSYAYAPDGSDAGWTIAVNGGATIRREVVRDRFDPSRIIAVSNFSGTVSLGGFAYAYDGLGRVIARNGGRFAYSARGELVESPWASYAYDAAGNLSTVSTPSGTVAFAANSLNQYAHLEFDADGGLLGFAGAGYSYDSAGRLASVSTGGVVVAAYAYDPLGRRIRKTTAEATHRFVYDGWRPVRESVAHTNGTTDVTEYFWGRDLSGGLDGAAGVGGLVCLKRNGALFVPLYDANGNVVAYVDGAGVPVAEYAYDGFGNTVLATGPLAEVFRFRYSTKYTEPEDGRICYGRRDYLPALGRWMTRDPIGEADSGNLYLFCGNNAVSRYDYLGMITAAEAFEHYRKGPDDAQDRTMRTPLYQPFGEIDTSSVRARDFPQVKSILESCRAGSHRIVWRNSRDNLAFSTKGKLAFVLGDISLKLEGVLDVKEGGDWTFSGTLKSFDDLYDFNRANRGLVGEGLTAGGRSVNGKNFWIEIRGAKQMSDSGNCCEERRRR